MSYTGPDYGTTPPMPAPAPSEPLRRQPTGSARGMAIGGFVCAAISLILIPIVFGVAGAVLGFLAYSKGERLGLYAGITSIACLVLGLVVVAVAMN